MGKTVSSDKLLKHLRDFNEKHPSENLSGKKFGKEKRVQFDEIYRHSRYLKDKGFIEVREFHEIGRSGPMDIEMKITATGIDYLDENRLIRKIGRGAKSLLGLILKVLINR